MWKAGSLDRAALRVRVDSLVKGFDESFFYEHRQLVRVGEAPVLIVGLPHCGSERCERLLSTRFALRVDALQLGFAALRFPNARIVHCARASTSDTGAPEHADLAFIQREHGRLMAHWRRVLPLRMHEWRLPEAR